MSSSVNRTGVGGCTWRWAATGLLMVVSLGAPRAWAQDSPAGWTYEALIEARKSAAWSARPATEREQIVRAAWDGVITPGPAAGDLPGWLRVTDAFAGDGTAAQRAALGDLMSGAAASATPEQASSLSVWDLWRLLRVVDRAGSGSTTKSTWVAAWFAGVDEAWVVDAAPGDLKLAVTWATIYLNPSARHEVFGRYHAALDARAAEDLTWAAESKLAPLTALLHMSLAERQGSEADAPPAIEPRAWAGLGVWDFYQVRESARVLGLFPRVGRAWSVEWFLASDAWLDGAGYQEVNALYDWLSEAKGQARGAEAMGRLLDYVRRRVLLDPSWLVAEDAESLGLTRVLVDLNPTLSHAELEEVAGHVIDRFVARPDLDADHWDYESFGALFASDALRQRLAAAVAADGGRPHVRLGKLVTWLNTGSTRLDAWRAELEQRAESASGDERALWLLIRAEAASPWALPLSAQRERSAGQWADDAVTAATTEAVRVEAVEWASRNHALFQRYDEARGLLVAEAARVGDPALRQRLDDLLAQTEVAAGR